MHGAGHGLGAAALSEPDVETAFQSVIARPLGKSDAVGEAEIRSSRNTPGQPRLGDERIARQGGGMHGKSTAAAGEGEASARRELAESAPPAEHAAREERHRPDPRLGAQAERREAEVLARSADAQRRRPAPLGVGQDSADVLERWLGRTGDTA